MALLKTLLLILGLLIVGTVQQNWQALGNMTDDNVTVIWDYIKENIAKGVPGADSQNPRQFAENISNYLNKQWDPAWNVIVMIDISLAEMEVGGGDSVIYGYAFRNHWMWYNNYKSSGSTWNFIIWKDYNCRTWRTLDSQSIAMNRSQSTYTGTALTQLNQVVSYQSSRANHDDIWGSAVNFVNYLTSAKSEFMGDHAYTIFITQFAVTSLFMRVCCDNYFTSLSSIGTVGTTRWGIWFVFQMR